MARYRKKPVTIEAFQLGIDYIPDWFMDKVTTNEIILHGTSSGFEHHDDTNADIKTLEGWHHASFGDFIIKGVKGEIYPCKPDIFEATYESADTTADVAPKSEVAREIFEEIESRCLKHIDRYNRYIMCCEEIAELKKKYTEPGAE
jgi:hypothetical protein